MSDRPPPPFPASRRGDARAGALVRLAWTSDAARFLSPPELQEIAARSLANNRASDLTGLLLGSGARFHAVLEGPQRALFARMERIILDPRHKNIRILREDRIDARRFANWSFSLLPDREGEDAQNFLASFLHGLERRR